MSGGFLSLEGVRKEFGGVLAVDTFNLEVASGEFVSFLGPSGCGKTTTLRMVAGFEQPSSGTIRLAGKDVTFAKPNERNIGMVFQSYALFPNMSVAGNIGFGMRIAKKPAAEIKARVGEMLKLIHMEGFGDRYPYQLSGGQQQRVALARALALSPQVLLLDEPLSALDAKIRVSLRNEIRSIQRELGITTIYVTHDQEEALSISDRVVVMYQGRIEQVGSPFEIYNFPTTEFVAQFVGTLNSVSGEVFDPAANIIKVEGQPLQTAQDLSQMHAGEEVMVAIRPERLSFASDGLKPNLIHCKIDNITFLGSIVRIQVLLGGIRLYMDTFNNPFLELPRLGDEAQITCSREAVMVLETKTQAAE
ncbi:MAG TPA: ABC transporter ATP-binding protein [Anaerolineales bacterium]|nr:ABC transporter ATP-binding protein [Anaerolineales bacterium]